MVADIALVLTGLLVGFLVGLTSIGTGLVGTPTLILLGVPPAAAVSAEIIQGTVMKAVAVIKHWRRGRVFHSLALKMVALGIPGAAAGSWLSSRLDAAALSQAVALILIGVSLLVVLEAWASRRQGPCRETFRPLLKNRALNDALLVLLGGCVGFLSGLTSIGSGTFIVLLFLLFLRIPTGCSVGTATSAGLLILSAAALSHASLGSVDLSLTAKLLAGSLPGVWLGTHLLSRAPAHHIRIAIAALTLAGGLRILTGVHL
ncbi:MAG: sulfite exporter TauE/SafE family protein [Candidatus Micrarchaeia archaeon]